MKRVIAAALALALVVTSPGLAGYEAAAQNFRTGGARGSSGAGNRSAVGSVSNSVSGSVGRNIRFNSSLNPYVALPGSVVPLKAGLSADAPTLSGSEAGPSVFVAGEEAAASVPAFQGGTIEAVPGKIGPVEGGLSKAAESVEAIAGNESVRELADPKGDRPGSLKRIFDNGKKVPGTEVAVGGNERILGNGLTARQPSAAGSEKPVLDGKTPKTEKKNLLARLRELVDLSDYSPSEKAFILGQAVFLLGMSIYITSLPLLVHSITGSTATTGLVRMVHYWVFGAVSLFAGDVVGRSPMKRVLVGAGMTRVVLYSLIGGLGLAGGLSLPVLLAIVAVNAVVVSHNHLVDIDAGGAAKVFQDKKKREKALYLYKTIRYAMLLGVPWILGLGLDGLDGAFGAGTGAKAGFVLLAAAMASSTWIYFSRLKISADATFETAAAKVSGLWAKAKSTAATGWKILVETPKRNWRTLKVIWGNKAILARSSMATFEQFIEDALFMVVLPTFVIDVLGAGNFGQGLVLSATYLGGMLASMILVKRAHKIEKKIGSYRFLVYLSVAASLAFLPSIGLWAAPSLWVTLPLVVVMKFLYDPVQSRMQALLQNEIEADPKAKAEGDNIYSIMTTFEVVAAGLGGLAFMWLFQNSGPATLIGAALGAYAPMKVVTIALAGFSLVYLLGLKWVKGQFAKPVQKVHASHADPAEAAALEAKALERLSASLKKMGLPEAKTVKIAGPAPAGRPTSVILSPASIYKLSIAREGGRQSPGDVHLAFDPSWLIQERYMDGANMLLLKKGLYFDENGAPVIAEYETPRRVHYFADFYTLGANDRADGVPLEEDLDVPTSSSVELEKVTNEKLLTRLVLAAKGVAVPATAAFLMAAHPLLPKAAQLAGTAEGVQIAPMPGASGRRDSVRRTVEDFLRHYEGPEVVVKPSGAQFHSARGVKFLNREDLDGIVAHVMALAEDPQMTEDGAVLVDGRLTPPALYLRTGAAGSESHAYLGERLPLHVLTKDEVPAAGPKEKKDWNLRVLAARTPWNGAVTTGIFARAGTWGLPTTAEPADPADAAAVVSLEDVIRSLRQQHGFLKTDAEAAAFVADLKKMGADALLALAANEAGRELKDGEARQAQTDYIGLDVMVERDAAGRLVPKIIEVNDHDAGGQWQLDQFYPERAGEHSAAWVATMLQRARRDALKGKRIVIVGAGYEGKRFIFERAKELGVRIVLVDKGLTGWAKVKDSVRTFFDKKSQDHWAKGLVSEFIAVDTGKPAEALAALKRKLARSVRTAAPIEGITTFWEDDVPLTADLAEALGLPYHSSKAARSVRSKFETRQVMAAAGLPTPRFQMIKSKEDLEAAIKAVGFPSVLKPVFGAAAMFVVRVNSAEEARAAYERVAREISPDADAIFKQGTELVLEQYLEGAEYDVDIVMQGGQARFVSVTDNWPTREPYFLATGSSLPSVLAREKQGEIEALAVATAKVLGLTDGVIHIEGKYTKEGPRIIEANGRMGGVYVRDWVNGVWGVDLVEENLHSAAGIAAAPWKSPEPLAHLEGEFLIPRESGVIAAFHLTDEGKRSAGFQELRQMKRIGDRIAVPPDGY